MGRDDGLTAEQEDELDGGDKYKIIWHAAAALAEAADAGKGSGSAGV